jgi:predicted DNA-binding protein (MmcQ/YjbR family)
MIESRCGIKCSSCEYKEQMNCKECINIEKPFWGDACPVKTCCENKKLTHCGLCDEFPCEIIKAFSFDKEQGDNGTRIIQCWNWNLEETTAYKFLNQFLQSMQGVSRDFKEEWGWIRYMVGEKMFAAICKDASGTRNILTLKLVPLDGEFLRNQYEDIIPGHYMNKAHWNSIYLDGSVPEKLINELIEKSYYLVRSGLSKKKQSQLENSQLENS